MRYIIALFAVLVALWATLSGYFNKPPLLVLGTISVIAVTWFSVRLKVVDREGEPYERLITAISFWQWLAKEIVKANMQVARAVLKPEMDVTPRLFKVRCKARSGLGRTTFANSITLTPGTVSVTLEGADILVHALLEEMSNPADLVEMNERAERAVSGKGERS